MGRYIHLHFLKQYFGKDRQEQSWGEEGWGWGDFGYESPGSKERSKDSIIDQGGWLLFFSLSLFVCLNVFSFLQNSFNWATTCLPKMSF